MLLLLAMLEDDRQRELFSQLYRQYSDAMLRAALRYFPHDPAMAEDAVQNAWLRVIKYFSKIMAVPCNKRGPYLVIIVKNEALTMLKGQATHLPLDEAMAGQTAEAGQMEDICRVIASLPDTDRRVLELRLLAGYSGKETAAILGMSRAAVNTRLHRARQLLAEKLREEGIDEWVH